MTTRSNKPPRRLSLGWGGRRPGAGRKPRDPTRPSVVHRARPPHKPEHPVYVLLRLGAGLPSLRQPAVYDLMQAALAEASKPSYRIVHYSVRDAEVHLMVEAQGMESLASGCTGLGIRLAHYINKGLGRTGRIWGDRYRTRDLFTPAEVRAVLVDLFLTGAQTEWPPLDRCSSARWFDGFQGAPPPDPVAGEVVPVRPPRTVLAGAGWRREGLLTPADRPRR